MAEPAIAATVVAAETWKPSRRMRTAAAAERGRVERELARLAARERQLAAELDAVQAARAELEHELDVLGRFAATASAQRGPGRGGRRLRALPDAGPSPADGTTVLRGVQIREAAVRVLAAKGQPEAPVHYRDWYELLTSQGFMPAGKDPLATFLTQLGRSPLVQRTSAAGVYVLDLGFPASARTRLEQLAEALAEVLDLPPQATVEEIAAARERRAQLTAKMQETERQLEEAVRSLGDAGA